MRAMKIVTVVLCGLAAMLGGCAGGGGGNGGGGGLISDDVPGMAAGIAIVALDIREILEADEPSVEQLNLLLDDLEALAPLVSDPELRGQLERVIGNIRSGFAVGLAIKAVVSGSVADLRALRDTFLRQRIDNGTAAPPSSFSTAPPLVHGGGGGTGGTGGTLGDGRGGRVH